MQALQPTAKIFSSRFELTPRECIAIFHRWIQGNRLAGATLFDVVDYSHVGDGPVVMLVANEGFLSLDRQGHRELGLLWRVRRGEPVGHAGLRAAAKTALAAASLFEKDGEGKIAFGCNAIEVGFDDRLGAPHDERTFAAWRDDLAALGAALYDDGASITPGPDAKGPFRALIRGNAASLEALAARL
jgi:hypothetical protein